MSFTVICVHATYLPFLSFFMPKPARTTNASRRLSRATRRSRPYSQHRATHRSGRSTSPPNPNAPASEPPTRRRRRCRHHYRPGRGQARMVPRAVGVAVPVMEEEEGATRRERARARSGSQFLLPLPRRPSRPRRPSPHRRPSPPQRPRCARLPRATAVAPVVASRTLK